MPIIRDDPYAAFNFQVEFPDVGIDGGAVRGGFSEVSGLNVEQEVVSYRNGNERSLAPRQLPGLVRYSNVTLTRGMIGGLELWQWIEQSLQGKPQRASGQIHLLNEAHDEIVMSWRIRDAWPVKFTGPDLNAAVSAVAIESLELAHAGIEIED